MTTKKVFAVYIWKHGASPSGFVQKLAPQHPDAPFSTKAKAVAWARKNLRGVAHEIRPVSTD